MRKRVFLVFVLLSFGFSGWVSAQTLISSTTEPIRAFEMGVNIALLRVITMFLKALL